jgi:hypothetical protein
MRAATRKIHHHTKRGRPIPWREILAYKEDIDRRVGRRRQWQQHPLLLDNEGDGVLVPSPRTRPARPATRLERKMRQGLRYWNLLLKMGRGQPTGEYRQSYQARRAGTRKSTGGEG